MIKNTLALLLTVATITACSSGSDSSTPTTTPTPGDDNPPATGTKAGTYTGDFGAGAGVYVIDNDNFLAGLALAGDGSATSLFGELGESNAFSGTLREYFHEESKPDGAAGSFGAVALLLPEKSVDISVSIGQGISGTGVSLSGASAGQLTTANAAALVGDWQGAHGFCDATTCYQLLTSLTFNGLSVSGSTRVDDGAPFALEGGITEFGEVSLISFTWGGGNYNGAVFFVPDGSGRLAFFGENAGSETPTIASLLTRQ